MPMFDHARVMLQALLQETNGGYGSAVLQAHPPLLMSVRIARICSQGSRDGPQEGVSKRASLQVARSTIQGTMRMTNTAGTPPPAHCDVCPGPRPQYRHVRSHPPHGGPPG